VVITSIITNSIIETDNQCRNICGLFNNVIFLQNESYTIIDNIKIFGQIYH
jgi:hypothetical protein